MLLNCNVSIEILGPRFHYSAGNAATLVLLRIETWPWHAEALQGVSLQEVTSQCREWDLEAHRVRAEPRVSWCQKPLWLMRRAERFSGSLVLWHCKVLQQGHTLRWGTNPSRLLLLAPEVAFCPEAALCGSVPALCKMIDSQSLSPLPGSGLWACCPVSQETTALACLWKADAVFCRHFYCYSLVLC